MMKYITFVVPCYNSESYMRRCVESLLAGGEDVGFDLAIGEEHHQRKCHRDDDSQDVGRQFTPGDLLDHLDDDVRQHHQHADDAKDNRQVQNTVHFESLLKKYYGS